MKKISLALLLITGLQLNGFSQDYLVEKLNTILKTGKGDTNEVVNLISLNSKLRIAGDNDASRLCVLNAMQLAGKLGYRQGLAISMLQLGRYYYFNDVRDSAFFYLTKALPTALELNDKKTLINLYLYIGFIYRPDEPFTAEEYYNKSLQLAEETKDELAESYALSAIGNVHENIFEGNSDENKKALDYYLKSLEIRERIGTSEEIASSLNETSRIYDILGLTDKVMELRSKGLQIAQKAGNIDNIIYLTNVFGNELAKQHDYTKALVYHLNGYSLVQKNKKNDFETEYDITKGIAYDYYCLGDLKKATEFYITAIAINDSIKAQNISRETSISKVKHNLELELAKKNALLENANRKKETFGDMKTVVLSDIGFMALATVIILIVIFLRSRKS
jgi:tetratricopeptide (TPR) repeat protein